MKALFPPLKAFLKGFFFSCRNSILKPLTRPESKQRSDDQSGSRKTFQLPLKASTGVRCCVHWPVRRSDKGVGRWGNGGGAKVSQFDQAQLSQQDVAGFHISVRRERSEGAGLVRIAQYTLKKNTCTLQRGSGLMMTRKAGFFSN